MCYQMYSLVNVGSSKHKTKWKHKFCRLEVKLANKYDYHRKSPLTKPQVINKL